MMSGESLKNKKINYQQQAYKFKDLLIEMCFDNEYKGIECDEDYYRIKSCEFEGWQEIFCRWLLKFNYIDYDRNIKQYKLKKE